MTVCSLHADVANFAQFFVADTSVFDRGILVPDGRPIINWHPPEITLAMEEENRGLQIPDIGHILPGSLVFSARAESILRDYLLPYGQLFAFDCEGETWFYFNPTLVIDDVLDVANSQTYGTQKKVIIKPAFFTDRLPKENAIFKVPETKAAATYYHHDGKVNFKSLIEENNLKGLRFNACF
jgi:hypothetical protein